jgi:hypothetical protein
VEELPFCGRGYTIQGGKEGFGAGRNQFGKWRNQHKKMDFHMAGPFGEEYNSVWQLKCGDASESLNN